MVVQLVLVSVVLVVLGVPRLFGEIAKRKKFVLSFICVGLMLCSLRTFSLCVRNDNFSLRYHVSRDIEIMSVHDVEDFIGQLKQTRAAEVAKALASMAHCQWDPLINIQSDPKVFRRHLRKLSLNFHPDKILRMSQEDQEKRTAVMKVISDLLDLNPFDVWYGRGW